MRQGKGNNGRIVRLSVVLDEDLAEFVRVRAFETRKSRSAYVRDLVATEASSRLPSKSRQEADR
jgi:metal-responsive CopG/Arc/MetJ family transcriptional regulator